MNTVAAALTLPLGHRYHRVDGLEVASQLIETTESQEVDSSVRQRLLYS
jgi:hypothetical protein